MVKSAIQTLSGDTELDLPEFDFPPDDPLGLMVRWLDEAAAHEVREPHALALATAGADGRPSNRIVLLKEVEPAPMFTSHRESRKGRDLAAMPWASGTLYWRETLQQVVIAGAVEPLSAAESDVLFMNRPRAAQAATIVSAQGEELDDHEALRSRMDELLAGEEKLSRPSDWGGYRMAPEQVEFWHGSIDRLHRRLLYTKVGAEWSHRRIQP